MFAGTDENEGKLLTEISLFTPCKRILKLTAIAVLPPGNGRALAPQPIPYRLYLFLKQIQLNWL